MLYFTGDTHGDFSRFRHKRFPEQEGLTKEDYVLICGDFGGVWNRSKEQGFWLDWLDEKPYTTLFVTGNHENYDLLSEFPVSSWRGGQVQRIRPSVLHLMRGQIFDIDGKRIFTMGGASCHDIPDGVLDPADPLFRIKKARHFPTAPFYNSRNQFTQKRAEKEKQAAAFWCAEERRHSLLAPPCQPLSQTLRISPRRS